VRACAELVVQSIWLACGVALSFGPTPAWIVGQVVLGLGFWRSFAIMHACGHESFAPSRALADAAGHLLSLSCWIPYFPWKYVHSEHHRWTGFVDRDPTMDVVSRGALPRWQARVVDFCWRAWIPIVSVAFISRHFFSVRIGSGGERRRAALAAFSIAFFVGAHVAWLVLAPWSWLRVMGVSTLVYLTLGDLSLLAQHVHLPMRRARDADVKPLSHAEQDAYSRTMVLPKWFDRWVALGFNDHAFHHLFPHVPYYAHPASVSYGQVNGWRAWLVQAKAMRATELLFGAEEEACEP
jgi:fatty acid desaturase